MHRTEVVTSSLLTPYLLLTFTLLPLSSSLAPFTRSFSVGEVVASLDFSGRLIILDVVNLTMRTP